MADTLIRPAGDMVRMSFQCMLTISSMLVARHQANLLPAQNDVPTHQGKVNVTQG